MQRFYQLQHLRSAQNSGIPRYLSLFYAGEIEISISLPPDKRNLNRGIYHTLIFDPLEMAYLQDFSSGQDKYPGQSLLHLVSNRGCSKTRKLRQRINQYKDQSLIQS